MEDGQRGRKGRRGGRVWRRRGGDLYVVRVCVSETISTLFALYAGKLSAGWRGREGSVAANT